MAVDTLSSEKASRAPEANPAQSSANSVRGSSENAEETPFVLSKNPFQTYMSTYPGKKAKVDSAEDVQPKADSHELSDLLLEVAVTTAIAGLTDGTDVVDPASALSYICFLGLAFWIWASQVLYDIRFRQKDWIHLFFALLQLLTFCALAGFAGGFDVGQGIRPDKDASLIQQLQTPDENQYIDGNADAENVRAAFIAKVNGIGIAAVMAFSRVVLLVQYWRAYYCTVQCINNPTNDKVGLQVKKYQTAIAWHAFSLTVGLIAYAIVVVLVGVNGKGDNVASNITVVVLCAFAVFFEIAMHFFADWTAGLRDLSYVQNESSELSRRQLALFKRTDTLFIILLGAGLDKITRGFQFIAGNVSVGPMGSVSIICAAIIFITLISSHFILHKTTTRPDHWQTLTWFIVNFFYLSAVILTLQGVAGLLRLNNLVNAVNLPLDLVRQFTAALAQNPTQPLVPQQFSRLEGPLDKLGLSLENMIYLVNNVTAEFGPDSENSTSVYNTMLWTSVVCIDVLLERMEADPQYGSLLYTRIDTFLDTDPTNATQSQLYANNTAYAHIVEGVRKSYGECVHWFFGAAGATLFFLFVLWSIIQPHWFSRTREQLGTGQAARNRREEWVQYLRAIFGIALILLLALNADNVEDPDDERESPFTIYGTRVHVLAQQGWLLVIVAAIMLTEQLLELVYIWNVHRREEHQPEESKKDPDIKSEMGAQALT